MGCAPLPLSLSSEELEERNGVEEEMQRRVVGLSVSVRDTLAPHSYLLRCSCTRVGEEMPVHQERAALGMWLQSKNSFGLWAHSHL